ncbi:Octaprenyl-diphosphate synthase [Planctomycetes bacterium Pan216]|uniref:Octaprenyl-diphosphate synthase n=1 Tax=Kolteria novifilia TaxID=2527975 RepID=A0A518B8I8_9BACT|nr:Octaprenyl-diphosphate synthase [Planctomycetes bacterium Pan216]
MSSTVANVDQFEDEVAPRKPRRQSTSHLKDVPPERSVRETLKQASKDFVKTVDRRRAFTKDELERFGRTLLEQHDLEEKYLGFAMVLIGNEFWKEQFLAVPFEKRMLLLPHCLKHVDGCPADYDEFGLQCETCGACSIADFKGKAEKLGYKVLVAEGTPIILKLIVSGYIDGILGVACLNVLEKAIDKVLIAGVPSYAVPLHSGDCKNTSFDLEWLMEIIDQYEPEPTITTLGYVPLLRASSNLFERDFDDLVPATRTAAAKKGFAPLAETERIGREYLSKGGKRFRPFVTLAAYDAMMRSREEDETPADQTVELPTAVKQTAMAIEAFHKASLIHDDIEDDDLYRYGEPTLHRRFDTSTAINVGDYLLGLGYRLVSQQAKSLDPVKVSDILDRFADAHVKLSEGQGAELAWRTASDKTLAPMDALKIYALKTAPAFEAALYGGLRLAGDVGELEEVVTGFSRQMGVGFQILNDLKDWKGDGDNKLLVGQDAMAMRPTLLLALALEAGSDEDRDQLQSLLNKTERTPEDAQLIRSIYSRTNVFGRAGKLVDKARSRCEAYADDVEPLELRQLLYYLVDTVLAEETGPTPLELMNASAGTLSLPIVSV